jgi:radical SAM protein (TIGR01212 family)
MTAILDRQIEEWRRQGYRYYPLGLSMRQRFNCNVWKISIDAGFSCPNADGTKSKDGITGGCIFCNTNSFAPSRTLQLGSQSIAQQIDEGIKRVRRRIPKADKFIAYFQPSTNTYAPVDVLENIYREAMRHNDVIGLAIGTRPDVLPDNVLDLLAALSEEIDIQLEIGLQTIHQRGLDFLNRGHTYADFLDSYNRAAQRNIRQGVHLILGLPNEGTDEIHQTAYEIAKLKPACVKLHNLYVVKNTPLEKMYAEGKIQLPTLEEYAGYAVDFIERLPPETVIERIAGEASDEFLVAPSWTAVKHAARNAVDNEFRRRNSFQGKLYHC